eukprot:COSAG02_NODE_644_length_18993_cov_6.626389_20_plen_339_part_00
MSTTAIACACLISTERRFLDTVRSLGQSRTALRNCTFEASRTLTRLVNTASCCTVRAHSMLLIVSHVCSVVDFAMEKGMTKATDFVLSGGSAGGLSTFLHVDRVAGRLKAEAPTCKKIRAAPIVGYFLDHDNFKHTTGLPGGPNSPQWAKPGTGATYTTWMRYVYKMQNMTFGADGALTKGCQKKFPTEPGLCFMSPHMQEFIETPFFMFNSKYDAWQLGNIFQSDWETKAEQAGVLQYGKDFMTQLAPVYLPATSSSSSGAGSSKSKNGGMITSCICHGCPWSDLVVKGKSSFQHYFDWSMGRTEGGVASMHIDPRLPNGGGALNGTTFQMCRKFPY